MPLWAFPHVEAVKRIDDGKYRFGVAFALFPFGTLLRYEGLLSAGEEPSTCGGPRPS